MHNTILRSSIQTGPGINFIYSAATPGVHLSPGVYMSPALIRINTVAIYVAGENYIKVLNKSSYRKSTKLHRCKLLRISPIIFYQLASCITTKIFNNIAQTGSVCFSKAV